MEMEDQYNISDLRQLMNGSRNLFPTLPLQAATDLFPNHRPPPPPPPHQHHQLHPHPYEHLMMMGGSGRHQAHELNNIPRGLHHHHEFRSPDSSAAGGGGTSNTTSGAAAPSLSGGGGLMEAEIGADIGGSGRWPRQETLTLLEIRSRLDFKFKEANQKGPLWDEVSRIMCEEHGYQRSGKKCREKFENLYKYYKKTKEGKAGRQDGKHYRFFRQLEALYGDATTTNAAASSPSLPEAHFIGNTNNNTTNLRFQTAREAHHHQKHCESLSISNNSSEFDTSSSEDRENNDVMDGDSQMRKRKGRGWKAKIKEFIDTHMRKLMEKQEEWMDRLMRTIEQKEKERTARDEEWRKSEIERVEREHKFWAKERAWIESRDKALMEALHKMTGSSSTTTDNNNNNNNNNNSNAQEIKGEEETKELLVRKKRKDNANSRGYFGNNNESSSSLYCGEMSNEHGGNEGSDSPSCRNANHVVGNENCFPFLMGEGDNLWENYGLKLSKASQNQQ